MASPRNPYVWPPTVLDKAGVQPAAAAQVDGAAQPVAFKGQPRRFRPEVIPEVESLPMLTDSAALSGLTAEFLQTTRQVENRLIMLSSARAGEGKTVNAINIAYGLTREAGLRTLLVDLNPEHPQLAELLGAVERPGLAEVLFGEGRVSETIFRSGPLGFDFMPFGHGLGGRLQLFNGPVGARLEKLLTRLANAYDYVLLDGPPVFGSSDPSIMAAHIGGVVMVIQCEQTRWEVVSSAEQRLREAGAKPLGAILNQRQYHVPAYVYGK